jgi:3-phosphoshikimate 1-carboxyvinyltransferase
MPLPDLIEIIPPPHVPSAVVTVPGSKSITNRALVLAALGHGETILEGALWSEDTQVMTECLQELGFMINVAPDTREPCNRTLTVYGQGGRVPRGGTTRQPIDLYVANAGTAARFLVALVSLGSGVYRLHGTERMHDRPQESLFGALRQLGYRVHSPNNRLPASIEGAGPRRGQCRVSIQDSSQFASALLLAANTGGWDVRIEGENAEESPYVAMTSKLIDTFPSTGGHFRIEPDASSGSYFWAAGIPCPSSAHRDVDTIPTLPPRNQLQPFSVRVAHWPHSGWQVDQRFVQFLTAMQSPPNHPEPPALSISRLSDLGDSIMTAIAIAPLMPQSLRFTDLGRLRLQECERVRALHTELTRCGARIRETNDTLTVHPSVDTLRGAIIQTYEDHRMAMSFATLGLKLPGLKLQNPACVKKTFPNFFQKLAAPPPRGLGAGIRDVHTNQLLDPKELFAD